VSRIPLLRVRIQNGHSSANSQRGTWRSWGVAVAVGAGIVSVGATAAANYAGPGVILSFILASIVCALAIMCYAEFASTLPIAGSAYTFSYATMWEFVAWLVGAGWAGKVISIGILIGLTSVIMVLLLGLTRVVFAMSRDGLRR
jgi:amino acid transporter